MSRVSGIAELVRLRILRGEIAPGERLVELLLAESLHTSRTSLRESLRLLEGRGLLVADEDGGMRVAELDRDALVETLQVRAALEALSAAEAAERRAHGGLDDAALGRVSAVMQAVATTAGSGSARSAVFADRTFHLAVAALADNRSCLVALDQLWDRLVAGVPSPGPLATHEHRPLVAAIADGDGEEAAAIARAHALAAAAV